MLINSIGKLDPLWRDLDQARFGQNFLFMSTENLKIALDKAFIICKFQ